MYTTACQPIYRIVFYKLNYSIIIAKESENLHKYDVYYLTFNQVVWGSNPQSDIPSGSLKEVIEWIWGFEPQGDIPDGLLYRSFMEELAVCRLFCF